MTAPRPRDSKRGGVDTPQPGAGHLSKFKAWLVRRAVLSFLRSKEGYPMLKFLEGKKEIIVTVLGAIALLLPVFGIAPDSIAALHAIQAAIKSGDWAAASTAVIGAVALLARAAYTAFLRRQQK